MVLRFRQLVLAYLHVLQNARRLVVHFEVFYNKHNTCKYRSIIAYVNISILEDSVIDILMDFPAGTGLIFISFLACCTVVGKVYTAFFFHN